MSEEKIMGFEEILGNEMVKDHFKKGDRRTIRSRMLIS